jgi:hypothetical protein
MWKPIWRSEDDTTEILLITYNLGLAVDFEPVLNAETEPKMLHPSRIVDPADPCAQRELRDRIVGGLKIPLQEPLSALKVAGEIGDASSIRHLSGSELPNAGTGVGRLSAPEQLRRDFVDLERGLSWIPEIASA